MSRLLLLAVPTLFIGCFEDEEEEVGSDTEEGGGEVWETDECDDEERKPLALHIDPNGLQCEVPVDCIQLPEAIDRGLASFAYDATNGLQLTNLSGKEEICIDGWYLLTTDGSQDSGAGDPGDDDDDDGSVDEGGDDDDDDDVDEGDDDDDDVDEGDDDDDDDDEDEDEDCDEDEDEKKGKKKLGSWGGTHLLGPRSKVSYGYAGNGAGLSPDNQTWWCVEKSQYTATTSDFEFTGAHMPAPLAYLILNETDLNANGIEDHVDTGSGYYQTNLNIWSYMDYNPVMAIGRDHNFIELKKGSKTTVTLEVTNLGRVDGVATFTEIVPANVDVLDISMEPITQEIDQYGRTVMTFAMGLGPAINGNGYTPTDYDRVTVTYTIALKDGASCPLRGDARAPEVTWADSSNTLWTSVGTPLTVSCCESIY